MSSCRAAIQTTDAETWARLRPTPLVLYLPHVQYVPLSALPSLHYVVSCRVVSGCWSASHVLPRGLICSERRVIGPIRVFYLLSRSIKIKIKTKVPRAFVW